MLEISGTKRNGSEMVAFDIRALNTVTFDRLILCTWHRDATASLDISNYKTAIGLLLSLSHPFSLFLFLSLPTRTHTRARIYNYYH